MIMRGRQRGVRKAYLGKVRSLARQLDPAAGRAGRQRRLLAQASTTREIRGCFAAICRTANI